MWICSGCLLEGSKDTANRCDKESQETEECKFRKITCESCDEQLVYVDNKKHQCTLRKEINEVKSRLDEMSDALKQVVLTQGEILEKLKAHDKSIKDIQNTPQYVTHLIENCLLFPCNKSFSFLHGKIIMLCGGMDSKRISLLTAYFSAILGALPLARLRVAAPRNTTF